MIANGKIVTLAREARGYTQTELAKKINEPQTTISAIENNKKQDDEIIRKISDVLNFPLSFFKSDNSINRLSYFYYRKRASFPTKSIGPLEAKMDIIRKSFTKLTKEIEINYKGLPQLSLFNRSSPEEVAQLLRLYLNLDDGPIEEPFKIVENIGIPVIYFDVESDKFSGMTIQSDNNIPIIIINKNLPNDHQKFTLFHEIGHQVMHVPFRDEPEFYDRYENNDVLEKEADQFAGAFLMPSIKAKPMLNRLSYSKLTELKSYWKVSKQAIVYRAKTLGSIDDRKFKNIYIELSRNGERKKESFDIPIDVPTLIKRLVSAYEIELRYTRHEIAENIAGLKLEDFENWFDLKEIQLFRINTK